MERVSARHEGDLGGQLPSFSARTEVEVRVTVDPAIADQPAAQHTAWMILNLLARTDGIISRVLLAAPSVPALTGVVPFGDATQLGPRLLEGANQIDAIRVVIDDGSPVSRTIRVGTYSSGEADTLVLGAGWWGGIALEGTEPGWDAPDLASAIPFGPYMAACFAVGDIYLRARGIPRRGELQYGWDCFRHQLTKAPTHAPEPIVNLGDVALAGVGAVGATWMHAIWAYPHASGLVRVVDADDKGVDETNLNRGVLFTRNDIGQRKSVAATRHAVSDNLEWEPEFGRFEDSDSRPALLVSAVDKNRARDALQNLYRPRLLAASTHEFRAEMLHLGRPGEGACLRCYLELEPRSTDEAARTHARENPHLFEKVAADLGLNGDEAERWLNAPVCGQITSELTERLRRLLDDDSVPQFSVGFVSVAAGTLLAAETVKVVAHIDDGQVATRSLRMQFWDPSANRGPRLMLRQRTCPKCDPGSLAVSIWARRVEDFSPGCGPIVDDGVRT